MRPSLIMLGVLVRYHLERQEGGEECCVMQPYHGG